MAEKAKTGSVGCRPFPDTFPSEEVNTIINAIRTPGSGDVICTAHCALTVVDFGLGQAQQSGMKLSGGVHGCSEDELCKHLEKAKEIWDRPDGMKATAAMKAEAEAFPWATLLPVLLNLITSWLSKR